MAGGGGDDPPRAPAAVVDTLPGEVRDSCKILAHRREPRQRAHLLLGGRMCWAASPHERCRAAWRCQKLLSMQNGYPYKTAQLSLEKTRTKQHDKQHGGQGTRENHAVTYTPKKQTKNEQGHH